MQKEKNNKFFLCNTKRNILNNISVYNHIIFGHFKIFTIMRISHVVMKKTQVEKN